MALSYKASGVDIDNADQTKRVLAEKMASRDPRILHRPGSFAALFEASFPGIREPVLVMKTEEPGSKQKLAVQHGRAASVAVDMVHHLINDIIVVGARPVCVQDCIVCGKLEQATVVAIVEAIARACRENDCALLGGETSEQPGIVDAGTYILSSSIVGVVEKSRILDGSTIRPGDAVLAVPSNGLHTNGYSLVRTLLTKDPALADRPVAGERFLDAILRPHACYYQAFKGLFAHPTQMGLRGIAHITGGGIAGNLNRILPTTLDAQIDATQLRILDVFKLIRDVGQVPDDDMLRTFNCGIGMTIVVDPAQAEAAIAHLATQELAAYLIGTITPNGSATVHYAGTPSW